MVPARRLDDGRGIHPALFDPPPDPDKYLTLIQQDNLKVEYVVITHGHSDHTWGVDVAHQQTGAPVVAHTDSAVAAQIRVDDGDTLELGSLTLRIIHTPGHADDSICILGGNKLISGDTLFVGKVGGLLQTIPTPVMGGILIILFGAIVVVGLNLLVKAGENLLEPRNLTIVALVLVTGVGGLSVGTADWALKGIGLAGIIGVVANLLLPGRKQEA